MNDFLVDPEEMAKRVDENIHAISEMIGEGSPVFESSLFEQYRTFERTVEHQAPTKLPESYQ